MKKLILILPLFIVFYACNSSNVNDDTTTGNLMELEASQEELDEIALKEQPMIVQDFFSMDQVVLGDDYCFNYSGLSQLILYGNDGDDTWRKFEISDNYLTAFNKECDVLLEFMTFDLDGKKMGFLSQMNKSNQQFNCLKWNENKNEWVEVTNYPRPDLVEYFTDLTREEAKIIKEYGADFVYINPEDETAKFVFSMWNLEMNLGEKELLEFNKPIDNEFELTTDDKRFHLNTLPLRITANSEKSDS